MITTEKERTHYTPAERKLAREMSLTTKLSLQEAYESVKLCRDRSVTPEQVERYAAEQNLTLDTAAALLRRLEEVAKDAGAPRESVAAAVQQAAPLPPTPQQGYDLRIRAPTNKGERRLIADIQKGIKAREAAMGQLARANRNVAKAERALRQAGMVTSITPAAPKQEGAVQL